MLHPNTSYRTNHGRQITIGGRIKAYSPERPFVWSIHGDWYHEETGQFVSCRQVSREPLVLEDDLLDADNWRSIQDHTAVGTDD